MSVSFRLGPIRPLIETRQYDENALTMQVGFTSYETDEDGEQTYQTSYIEWGGRSDHLDDVIDVAMGREVPKRLVRNASESERRYVGSDERNGITAAKLKTVDVEAEAV